MFQLSLQATMASTKVLGSGDAALRVSSQGFGCMGITAFYGKPMPDDEAVALLRHAYENGVTHWDTAEVYQAKLDDGSIKYNEETVGKAIAAVGRANVTVATKYMPTLHDNTLTAAQAVEAARASCARLGVETIDLYYVHRLATGSTCEEQAAAMCAVKEAGLARHIGVSEFSPRNLRAFHALCPVTCVQQEWSLLNRDLEDELVPLCRELGVGIVAYAPLCRSLLGGAVKSSADLGGGGEDARPSRYGRFAPGNLERNAALVDSVVQLAAEHGVSAAQLSLAWVSAQGDDVVPIPGTTKIAHLDDNLAARAVMLTPPQRRALEEAVPQEKVAGDRYGGGDAGTFKANM